MAKVTQEAITSLRKVGYRAREIKGTPYAIEVKKGKGLGLKQQSLKEKGGFIRRRGCA